MPRGLSPLQCNEIEASGAIPAACRFLNPTLHYCWTAWGGLLIDDSDPEFNQCRCEEDTFDAPDT